MSFDVSTSINLRLTELLALARAGDNNAIGELIREFEPEVRRFVRFRLSSAGLRRIVDSVDLAQSVFARFFVYLEGGGDALEDIDQLRRYLITSAKNAVIDRVRRERASRRDNRRLEAGQFEMLAQIANTGSSPSADLTQNELLTAIRQRLTPDELYLVEQWQLGRPWDDIAKELGRQPDAIRKQMSRALDRVAADLRIIDGGHQ